MSERHIIPISGKDSLATALLQTAKEPDLPYEYVFCDVGAELPETYAWLDSVERATGWEVQRVGASLERIIAGYNLLPSHGRRFCTREAKVKPLDRFHGKGATVYYGIRADEARVGPRLSGGSRAAFPLIEMGIDLRGVWTILAAKNLLPPSFFWPSLFYRVCEHAGGDPSVVLQPWEAHLLFSGRSRSNCFFCFYQRQYEYIWLAETHPNLFWRACRIERTTGGALTTFRWKQEYYLDELLARRQEILDRRAQSVLETINRRLQGSAFGVDENELATTSCGLLCGK